MSTPCRCKWCEKDPLYIKYHDTEWGVPVHDDQKLFECLLLETFQAGLSWITVLRKRENFRKAFDHFDYHKIALYDEGKIQELLQVENAFKLLLVRDGNDTQISLTWNNLDEKRVEEVYCENCNTKRLRESIEGIVEKLVSNN